MSNWTNDTVNFWADLMCDELFLMFDTSAHAGNGVPATDVDAVLNHVMECPVCQDADVTVYVMADGHELEAR